MPVVGMGTTTHGAFGGDSVDAEASLILDDFKVAFACFAKAGVHPGISPQPARSGAAQVLHAGAEAR